MCLDIYSAGKPLASGFSKYVTHITSIFANDDSSLAHEVTKVIVSVGDTDDVLCQVDLTISSF